MSASRACGSMSLGLAVFDQGVDHYALPPVRDRMIPDVNRGEAPSNRMAVHAPWSGACMSQSICASIIGMNGPKTRRQVTARRAHRGIARQLTGRRRFAVEPQSPQHVLRCLARFLDTLAAMAPEVARTTRCLQAVRHRHRCSGARRRARPDREAGAQGAGDRDEGIHLAVVAAVAYAGEEVPTLS